MNQSKKAEAFRQQHHSQRILLLPNVWDALSARLISSAGFDSLATASFSIAASNGYQDGEKIPFQKVVDVVADITDAVTVPVSVDFERGYASDLPSLADNIKRLLDAGAVGINIEDRASNGKELISIAEQCKKIETIREAGLKHGINIVVNARTDAYLLKVDNYMNETIQRGKAFKQAGADGFYPVAIDNYSDIERVLSDVSLPLNVLLQKSIGNLETLEKIGVKRVSLGPGSLKYVLTKLRRMITDIKRYDTAEFFSEDLISSNDVMSLTWRP